MRFARCGALALTVFVQACVSVGSQQQTLPAPANTSESPSSQVLAQFTPRGALRAAINFGNPILAQRGPQGGDPTGVSVDLARALAQRLNRPLQLVTFDSAGKVFEALKDSAWDVAFLAIDPARATEIAFSPAYLVIEGAYLVRENSLINTQAQVDQPGTRIVVGRGSAYDLYLSRQIKQAKLIYAPTSPAVTDVMISEQMEVAAGVKQQLAADAKRHPGTRLLPGSFMAIHQAMGIPRGREAASQYLDRFVEQMKADGFVAQSLQRHAIEGATIAPPQR